MKVRSGSALHSCALCVLITATVFAASCAEAPGTPTTPSAGLGTLSSPSQTVGRGDEAVSAASTQGVLLLTKTCDALDHCRVISAPFGPIPMGSDVDYFGPLLESRTTSRILISMPHGGPAGAATGHCSLSYKTGEGTCVITGGTGALAGLHANVKVSSDFVADPGGVFTWEGRYHFER